MLGDVSQLWICKEANGDCQHMIIRKTFLWPFAIQLPHSPDSISFSMSNETTLCSMVFVCSNSYSAVLCALNEIICKNMQSNVWHIIVSQQNSSFPIIKGFAKS